MSQSGGELKTGKAVIPTSLWYRFNDSVNHQDVVDFLNGISQKLTDHHRQLGINLINLPVFKRLMTSMMGWGVEFTEGPLALLLLFALRANFNQKSGLGSAFEVCDDSGTLLPDSFEQLDQYLDEFLDAYCIANGWHSEGDYLVKGKIILNESATKFGREMFISIEKIRPFALTMGCMPGYFDLSLLESTVAPAFF